MRGAWLVLLGCALPLGSCSGGYSLEPTQCDDWCDATKGSICASYYSPASCVVQCEQIHLDTAACQSYFDAALACFRSHPDAVQQRCVYDSKRDDCEDEVQLVTLCATGQLIPYEGNSGQQ